MGPGWGRPRRQGEAQHPLSLSLASTVHSPVSSSVTLSHVGSGRLWEVLGLAQVQRLGGSLITQACLAFEPIVHTLDTPVVFEHF